MQLSGDTALATAVNADIRHVCWKLEVDWNKDGDYDHAYSDLSEVVRSMEVDRDITSALPFQTSMIEGFMAAQLTFRLGGRREGDSVSIGKILSPLRTDSPLYGLAREDTPVRAWIGMRKANGTETQLQQFQGKISQCRVSGALEVSITALDGAEDTRAEINLPFAALPPGSATAPEASMRIKINSQWPIDYIFRRNGMYSSPPPHERVFYCATMHGSVVPELGHSTEYWVGDGVLTEDTQQFYPGRTGWGLGYGGNASWYYLVKSRGESTLFTGVPGQSLVIQLQADLSRAAMQHPMSWGTLVIYSTGNSYLVGTSFRLNVNQLGKLSLDFYNGITAVTTVQGPTLGTAGWTDCWVEIELGSPLSSSTVRFPGLTVSGVNLSGLSTAPTLALYPHITTVAAVPIQDMHISNRTGLAAGATRYDPTTWVPEVDLDPGLNEMTGLPIRRRVQSWDLLKEIVGAEFGVVGFSESGRPFFKNRDTLRRQNLTIEKALTADKEMADIGVTEGGGLRNSITVVTSERLLTGPSDSATAWRTVYNLDNPNEFVLSPGITIIDVTLDTPGALIDPYVEPTLYSTAAWQALNKEDVHGFAASTISGAQVTSGVSLSIVPLSPRVGPDLVRLVFNNNAAIGTHIKLMTTDFNAALKLRGRSPYTADPVVQSFKRDGSIVKYGERVYEIPTSEWLQTARSGQAVALSLLHDLGAPVPTIDQIEAVGDPRLQLQDTATFDDVDGVGGPIYVNVMGCRREVQATGTGAKLSDRLTVRPFSAPGRWILGHPTQSQLGSTTKL